MIRDEFIQADKSSKNIIAKVIAKAECPQP